MLVDGLKADVKDIKSELNEVKNSLNFSGRDITEIQDKIKVLSNQLKEVDVQVFNHHDGPCPWQTGIPRESKQTK